MSNRLPCPDCQRSFVDAAALAQHRKFKHRVSPDRPRRDDHESLADIAINAEVKRALGQPLKPLEESLLS